MMNIYDEIVMMMVIMMSMMMMIIMKMMNIDDDRWVDVWMDDDDRQMIK
jgi:hypothetical protein